jgi:16S rRNA (adenine1518-N6/adenine1519-N6)-dimethyltransferase
MNLEETKSLLRKLRIVPNKLMGQNFLVDASIYPKLAAYASLNSRDVVLDVGAGLGFLTRFLANKCKAVVAVEKDSCIAEALRAQVKELANTEVIEGDVLHVNVPAFNKVVAAPPYYLSSQLLTWLFDRRFDCAALILQYEFASRLVAAVGSEEYGWLTVVTRCYAEAELLDAVPKWMFHPSPEVDSVIVRLKPWSAPPFAVKDKEFFRRLVRWLFTQRNKKLSNAVVPFLKTECSMDKEEAKKIASGLPQRDRRARELSPKDFGEVANALSN